MLKLPQGINNSDHDQLKYGVNKRCLYQKVLEEHNNQIVVLGNTYVYNEEDQDRVYESILHWIEARMNERILIGTFGTMRTSDKNI